MAEPVQMDVLHGSGWNGSQNFHAASHLTPASNEYKRPGENWKKLRLLLWKNWTIQKRHKLQTLLTILIPVVLSSVLVITRILVAADKVSAATIYEPFDPHTEVPTVLREMTSRVIYTPNDGFNDELMERLNRDYFAPQGLVYTFQGFPTEADLVNEYKASVEGFVSVNPAYRPSSEILAGVVFETSSSRGRLPHEIKYSLKFPAHQRSDFDGFSEKSFLKAAWFTDSMFPLFRFPGPRAPNKPKGGFPGYFAEGFLFLQAAIDSTITRMLLNSTLNQIYEEDYKIKLQRFPFPAYTADKYVFILQQWMPVFLATSFLFPVMTIARQIVQEKESRLKEFMRIMGLANWLHWAGWFIQSLVSLLVTVILITFILKYPVENCASVLSESNSTIIAIILFAYVFSLIGFAFFISSLFDSAGTGACVAGIVSVWTYIPYFFLFPRFYDMGRLAKILSSFLLPNVTIGYTSTLFSIFEGRSVGVQWRNLAEPMLPTDGFCMRDMILMMFLNGTLFFLASFYVEQVWPGKYGIPLPWYFPFTTWYWKKGLRPEGNDTRHVAVDTELDVNPEYFEASPAHLKPGVEILGLTKKYAGSERLSVNNVSLNMFKDQVTALLGRNGAGKTTMYSMLCGLIPPSSGTAIVDGKDICKNMKAIRSSLGFCPQYDVVVPELTVKEHLQFACLMKGFQESDTDAEIERMLKVLELESKRNAQAQTLSGGMKRKLSVGMAFCAGSKVVLLDEPTSGMDPGARRSTWNLIQKEKGGRAVIISTHFLDEADVLGDRIAIMIEGRIQCCGSSLYLKKTFGGDYSLNIVRASEFDGPPEQRTSVEKLTQAIRSSIPSATLTQNVVSEVNYNLPGTFSANFPALFEELEERKEELGIASYGVGQTSMEQIFMRVGDLADKASKRTNNAITLNSCGSSDDGSDHMPRGRKRSVFGVGGFHEEGLVRGQKGNSKGVFLTLRRVQALLVKKLLYAVRNRNLILLQMALPLTVLTMCLYVFATLPSVGEKDPSPLPLNFEMYKALGETTIALSGGDVCARYADTFSTPFSSRSGRPSESFKIEMVNKTLSFPEFILARQKTDLGTTNSHYIIGCEQKQTKIVLKTNSSDASQNSGARSVKTEVTGFFNNEMFHTPPLALNALSNSILSSFGIPHTIHVTNHPFPYLSFDVLSQSGNLYNVGFIVGWSLSFGTPILASSFVLFPIEERERKMKLLQYLSGVSPFTFWLVEFFVDLSKFMIVAILALPIAIAFGTVAFYDLAGQLGFLGLNLLYGWAIIPSMGLLSLCFKNPANGYALVNIFHTSTGVITMAFVVLLAEPAFELQDFITEFHKGALALPTYALGMGIAEITFHFELHKNCAWFDLESYCLDDPNSVCCTKMHGSYWSWEVFGVGRNAMALFVHGLLCFVLLFLAEKKVLQKLKSLFSKTVEDETPVVSARLVDSDVFDENQRVNKSQLSTLFASNHAILRNLTKVYSNGFVAVDKLNFAVRKGEIFGLLGVNGAGKTTTFKMLTGDISSTGGDAFLATYSIKRDIQSAYANIGYCPQFDALIDQLTGRETIRFFSRLKGIPERSINKLADELAQTLYFTEFLDKYVGSYSGGNKRKLSTAVAMLGNPSIIFLDEPTTGMDPVARRHLWGAISKVRDSGTSIIITSHNMEECEILCNRIGIMVRGQLRCLGSPQHLKNKFGDGYTVIAQFPEDANEGATRDQLERNLKLFIQQSLPGSVLKDSRPGFLEYYVGAKAKDEDEGDDNGGEEWTTTWSQLFSVMEQAKLLYSLDAYSVGQTSMDQVYFNFTQ